MFDSWQLSSPTIPSSLFAPKMGKSTTKSECSLPWCWWEVQSVQAPALVGNPPALLPNHNKCQSQTPLFAFSSHFWTCLKALQIIRENPGIFFLSWNIKFITKLESWSQKCGHSYTFSHRDVLDTEVLSKWLSSSCSINYTFSGVWPDSTHI